MSPRTERTVSMLEMLPEEEQKLAETLIERLVLAWDPDFSKVTSGERARIEAGEKEIENGEFLTSEEVWSELKKQD